MKKKLYIGFTTRKGDIIALCAIGLLLIAQLCQVVYALGYKFAFNPEDYTNPDVGFIWEPNLLLFALILYIPPYISVYAGVLFYLLRDKNKLPRRPMFYSKNKVVSSCLGVVYFILLLGFFWQSVMIAPSYDGSNSNDAIIGLLGGATITCVIWIPLDLIGLFLWYRNYGIEGALTPSSLKDSEADTVVKTEV